MKVISAIQSSKSAGCVALAKATVAPTSQQQCACYSTLAPVLFGKCGSSFSDSTWHGDYMSVSAGKAGLLLPCSVAAAARHGGASAACRSPTPAAARSACCRSRRSIR